MSDIQQHPAAGMVLCAGHGTRMRPLSLTTPKPLIKVDGTLLADYAVNQLASISAQPIVVNAHYLAEQVFDWAKKRSDVRIKISDESKELLDTGGGVANALAMLGSNPFFVLNSDAFWIDPPDHHSIKQMQTAFDNQKMDFLLLLAEHKNAIGFDGPGDFFCSETGALSRRGDKPTAPYIYAGCYVVNPRVFKNHPVGPFSMNVLWNRAIQRGRIFGYIHTGLWLHVGTPQAISEAENAIKTYKRNQR